MSVPTSRQAFAFLKPLRGRTSAFITPSRRRNLGVTRFLVGCLAATKTRVVIFDTSSFFGTNACVLTESLPKDFLQQSMLMTPQVGIGFEDSLAELISIRTQAILIDDLNAVDYLLSSDRRGSGIHQLFAFFRLLSYKARILNMSVFTTVYGTGGESKAQRATRRSLSAMADLQISTDSNPDRLTFSCSGINDWPNSRFSTALYF